MDWMEGFSDDLKENDTLKGFDGPEALARGHIDLTATAGTPWKEGFSKEFGTEENLNALKDMDTPEALAKAYSELKAGQPQAPEKPEDYEIPSEGVEINETLKATFTQSAHKAGLSQDQVNAIAGGWNSFITGVVTDAAEAEKKEHDAAVNTLKDLWKGQDYEKNTESANRAFAAVGQAAGLNEEDLKFISDRYGDDPRLIQIMHTISTKISPDVFEKGGKDTDPGKEQTGEQFIEEVFKEGNKGE